MSLVVRFLLFFEGSTGRVLTDFPLSAHRKPSTLFSALPTYLQEWLARDSDDDDEDTLPPPTGNQDSVDIDTDYGFYVLQRSHDSHEESHYVTQPFRTPLTTGESVDPDELFEEAAMAFASEYLNLDYETLTFADHTVDVESSSPPTSSVSSSSSNSTAEGGEVQWEIEPTSLSLLDATKFEIGIDANGGDVRNPWPWGDHTYRLPSPPRYPDLEDYVRECQLAKIEEGLRVQLSERFAENAIRGDKEERRREKQKAWGVEGETSTPIVAFSQVIRGRTIYNP